MNSIKYEEIMNKKKFNILVAPNSFKECASSVEIAKLIDQSLKMYIPETIKPIIELDLKPISDGGDGFLPVCERIFNLEILHFEIRFPYSEDLFFCPVAYSAEKKFIFIESAEVLGLKLLPEDKRKPMMNTSKGMGDLLLQIYDAAVNGIMEIEHVFIGIGGTGTNDLGMGALEVFGLEIYDDKDNPLAVIPKNFKSVQKIIVPEIDCPFKITTIIDVRNPLVGSLGASIIFGQQKGASPDEVFELDESFKNILTQLELSQSEIKHLSGAGGGLSAALKLFFKAEEITAVDFLKDFVGINFKETSYDLVITGEGQLDAQSFLNKGAVILLNEATEHKIPTYFICGTSEGELPKNEFLKVIELAEYFDTVEESIEKINKGIELACKPIARALLKTLAKQSENN
jgi:glycerate kinase